jgi:carboxynorspermidine decarboxylase
VAGGFFTDITGLRKAMNIDFNALPSPCYIVDEGLLEKNLEILHSVQERTGCSILLALKSFSMFSVFPLAGRYLKGITASSLNEARLGYEEMGREVHIYSPAYIDSEFDEILRYSDHIVFNSFIPRFHSKTAFCVSKTKKLPQKAVGALVKVLCLLLAV